MAETKKPYDPTASVLLIYTGAYTVTLHSSLDFGTVDVLPNSKSPVQAKYVYNLNSPEFKCVTYKSIKNKQTLPIPSGMTFKQFVETTFSGSN